MSASSAYTLTVGEFAVNLIDKKLFSKDGNSDVWAKTFSIINKVRPIPTIEEILVELP